MQGPSIGDNEARETHPGARGLHERHGLLRHRVDVCVFAGQFADAPARVPVNARLLVLTLLVPRVFVCPARGTLGLVAVTKE